MRILESLLDNLQLYPTNLLDGLLGRGHLNSTCEQTGPIVGCRPYGRGFPLLKERHPVWFTRNVTRHEEPERVSHRVSMVLASPMRKRLPMTSVSYLWGSRSRGVRTHNLPMEASLSLQSSRTRATGGSAYWTLTGLLLDKPKRYLKIFSPISSRRGFTFRRTADPGRKRGSS